jgi:DNA replication protein DnaC
MDEIAQILKMRKLKTIETPQTQSTGAAISTQNRERAELDKLSLAPHKRGTGQICGVCGEEKMQLVIPSINFIQDLPCSCEKKRIAAEKAANDEAHHWQQVRILTEHAQLPAEAHGWTFKNFIPRKDTEAALKAAKHYAEDFKSARKLGFGLIFYGCTGCGKSHLAAAIANTVIQQEYSVRWWTVPELYAEIRGTYHGNGSEADILHECKNVSLLVLDDLGAEKPTEWTQQTVNTIINARIANKKPTVITTNLGIKELSQHGILDERTISRISDKDRFKWLLDGATDYRRTRHD